MIIDEDKKTALDYRLGTCFGKSQTAEAAPTGGYTGIVLSVLDSSSGDNSSSWDRVTGPCGCWETKSPVVLWLKLLKYVLQRLEVRKSILIMKGSNLALVWEWIGSRDEQ